MLPSSVHSGGGCSSMVEHWTVAPVVAGSIPVIHPKSSSDLRRRGFGSAGPSPSIRYPAATAFDARPDQSGRIRKTRAHTAPVVPEYAMSKVIAVLGSALFFVIAPLMLAGFIPWWVTQWEFRPAFFGLDLTRILGGILIIVGVPGLVDSFSRFALEGLGTPAPIAPPQKLVVTGLYRYVRNPIYIAVVAVIFGQALLFGDWRLIWYGALLWLVFHVAVVMYEEPTLKETFGTEYESFRTNVPRWIPRLTPWRTL